MELDEIILKAPKLAQVVADAETLSRAKYRIKNRLWYKDLKPRMSKLVGFHCDNNELSTTEIYDKVYQFLIELMGL